MNNKLDIQQARLNFEKAYLDLIIADEETWMYSNIQRKDLDTYKHYIEDVLGIKSFDEQIYQFIHSKEISKKMKCSDRYKEWFVGDVMCGAVWDCCRGDMTREELDKLLLDVYLEFLWIKRLIMEEKSETK